MGGSQIVSILAWLCLACLHEGRGGCTGVYVGDLLDKSARENASTDPDETAFMRNARWKRTTGRRSMRRPAGGATGEASPEKAVTSRVRGPANAPASDRPNPDDTVEERPEPEG